MTTSSYYSLLGIDPNSPQEAVDTAYQRQRERYDPARVADLDVEMRAMALERTAELDRAYAVLADPERRRQYDASLSGDGGGLAAATTGTRRGLSPRERTYAVVGALLAVALVATIWVLTGRDSSGVIGQAMPELNREAPTFDLPELSGGTISLADYQGQVVLLNFWGTWCEPCKRELPALEQAHQSYGDQGLAVIGVNLTHNERTQGSDEAAIKAFLEQFGVTYPTALDEQGEVTNAYRVFPLPTSFFIDGEGRIRYVHIGELTFNDVEARFLELSGQAQPEYEEPQWTSAPSWWWMMTRVSAS
jgi:cytochrome c biogenesis protein CcmG, thiol:disulfide interchange protein DsbE